jgi:diguanylate cyclase (GGDEF)-like protein
MTGLISTSRESRRLPPNLLNRTDATKRLATEMVRAQREADHQFSMILVEFRGLTHANSRLGYAYGNDSWERVLRVLMQDLQADDLCCRLGGDEFILVLSGRGEAAGRQVAEGIRRAWTLEGHTGEDAIQASFGVAGYPTSGSTIEALFAAADVALYSDKLRNERASVTPSLQHVQQAA